MNRFKDITIQSIPLLQQRAETLGASFLEAGMWRIYKNDTYQVIKEPHDTSPTHLSIKRLDKESIHDWRDLQQIKNELCGEECEAVEIYPAESRLVDAANQYHLWVFPEGFRIPFGYQERLTATPEEAASIGAKQRGQ